MRIARLPLVLSACAVLLVAPAACSSDGGPVTGTEAATTEEILTTLADGVIIPSYEALTANLAALGAALDGLCGAGSSDAVEQARAQWRDVELAWGSTRATGVGPAIDQRAMGAIAFRARADKIDALLAGTEPLHPDALAALGSDVRGIYAVEVALFGPGSDALAGPAGARRCELARGATALATAASDAVLDAWTGPTPAEAYRARFIAGMDGDAISSVEAIVNEVTFRLQQIDDQGLRALRAAKVAADLPENRREGPAATGVAGLRGVLGGVAAAVLGPDGEPGLAALVRGRSATTADRLEELTREAVDAVGDLPSSSVRAIGDRARLRRAADAVAALRVLVSTEVASQLGVTIGFSDADGDS